jgi:hypothetical protein
MTRPMIRIHNTATDEVVDREMTVAEFKQYEADQLAYELRQTEAEAKATAKAAAQAKLAAIGLTVEDLQALGL